MLSSAIVVIALSSGFLFDNADDNYAAIEVAWMVIICTSLGLGRRALVDILLEKVSKGVYHQILETFS